MADRVASIVVAVPSVPGYLAGTVQDLKYAFADAHKFHEYVRKAWPHSDPSWHVRLPNKDRLATLQAIRDSAHELSAVGKFDMLFVYLTGHAFRGGPDRAWFCTAELMSGQTGVDARELNRLLATVSARHTFLFLDCCHAAAIVEGTTFFTALEDDSIARLYICSSRSGQLTWEDDSQGHGLFSAVLLEALRTGQPGRNARGPLTHIADIDVDGELFPYMCIQVPLLVQRLKNRAQEPVKGGVARWSVRLPVGEGLGGPSTQTVLGVVLRKLRRIAINSALATMLGFVFVEFFLYHLMIDGGGHIVVDRGVRPVAAIVPRQLLGRVQTDFVEQEVMPDPEVLGSLRRGSAIGVWRHLSGAGYREWLNGVLPHFKAPTRARVFFEVTGRLPPDLLSETTDLFEGWRSELVAQSLLRDPDNRDEREKWLARYVPKSTAIDPGTGEIRKNVLDFAISNLSREAIVRLEAATEFWAASNPDAAMDVFLQLVPLACYRAAHDVTDEDARVEAHGLQSVLKAIAAARMMGGGTAFSGSDIQRLSDGAQRLQDYGDGRQLWMLLPMAGVGTAISQEHVQSSLGPYLESFDLDRQGSLLTLQQSLALDALASSAKSRPLDEGVLCRLMELSSGLPNRFMSVPDFEHFLVQVAPCQPLPACLREVLWRFVRNATDPLDVDRLFALRILAANSSHLPSSEKDNVVAAAASIGTLSSPMEVVADIYGWLGVHGFATEAMVQSLSDWLIPHRQEATDISDEGIPATVIRGGNDEPAGLALGQISRQQPLPAAVGERLYGWSVTRESVRANPGLMEGLARQRQRTAPQVLSGTTIRSRIVACALSAEQRSVESHIAIWQLLAMPRPQRLEILSEIMSGHETEEEVEVRQALHRIWLGTRRVMDVLDSGLR